MGSGFDPLAPHLGKRSPRVGRGPVCGPDVGRAVYRRPMASGPSGHIERLPSGSWRARVYAGVDPLTRREIRLRETCRTERAAQIALGKLLEQAAVGRQPESNVTVATLMDEYAAIAEWELSTREANEGYIRRTIKPALGHLQVRKVRGPILDKLYARLKRCSDPSCTGRPFTEHRHVPILIADPADSRPGWEQAAGRLRDAIVGRGAGTGRAAPLRPRTERPPGGAHSDDQHALAVLADERLIILRHGRTAVVAGEAEPNGDNGRARRPGRGHDCKLAGCRPHVCKPMKAKTIRNIHSILSGAFATAKRWDWIDWNPRNPPSPRPSRSGHCRHRARGRGGSDRRRP